MAYVSVPTAVTGSVVTAAYGNILRDNDANFNGLLTGTVAGAQVAGAPGTTLIIDKAGGQATHRHAIFIGDGSTAVGSITPATDEIYYYALNTLFHWINVVSGTTTELLRLAADGKLTGVGFYDSGELSMAASASSSPSHGLGAKPRFVFGYWSATTGEVAGTAATGSIGLPGATVSLTSVSSTTIVVQNTGGATRYARVLAML